MKNPLPEYPLRNKVYELCMSRNSEFPLQKTIFVACRSFLREASAGLG